MSPPRSQGRSQGRSQNRSQRPPDRWTEQLTALLTAPMSDLGLDLESVETGQAGRRRTVRVAVDKDGGVSLDEVAEATRQVSRVLDDPAHADVTGEQPYTLEVGSPGVDRPLTLPRHWRRNHDRLVKVELTDGTRLTGRVTATDERSATLEVSGHQQPVAFDDVATARVQVELKPKRKGS